MKNDKDIKSKCKEAISFIRDRAGEAADIKVAVILGSGLSGVGEALSGGISIKYSEIPNWPLPTVDGHDGEFLLGSIDGVNVAIMKGRVHYYEGYSMEEVTFPSRILALLGTKVLLATNASGGVDLGLKPGSLVAIYDHINFMGMNPLRGPNVDEWGPRFPDTTYAYDKELLDILDDAAKGENVQLGRGVYIAMSGPSFETPAEIRMARTLGADLVGMSTVPEILIAAHMGVRAAAVSCVSNHAAGVTADKLTHEEVLEGMARASESMKKLIVAFIKKIAERLLKDLR